MPCEDRSRSRCCRPQQTFDTIEYQIDDSKISLSLASSSLIQTRCSKLANAPRASPTLITFPIETTLSDILQEKNLTALVVKPSSSTSTSSSSTVPAYFELDGKALEKMTSFKSIEPKHDLVLVIDDSQKFKFTESKGVPKDSVILEEFRKTVADRLPLNDGNRPTATSHLSYPNDSLDLLFDTFEGQLNYLTTFLLTHFGDRHEFTTYAAQQQGFSTDQKCEEWQTGVYRMRSDSDGIVNIALASDWGAGTLEAALVARAMVNGVDLTFQQENATADLPDYTIHLGDIYYVGLPSEIEHCCLGVKPEWADQGVRWPIGKYGSWSIPGNHELYSRGFGYWDHFLPAIGQFDPKDLTRPVQSQKTSYWVLENDQWRIIGLDTGYDSFSLLTIDNFAITLPSELIEWLRTIVGIHPEMTDKRGLIFFSHHQVISAWNEKPNTEFPAQIAALLPEGRTVLWLWGHEHRLSFYQKQTIQPSTLSDKKLTFYGRCVGNSGFPTLAKELPIKSRETQLLFYDDRLYHFHDNEILPDFPLGFNGYATMKFIKPSQNDGTSLYMSYKTLRLDEDGKLTYDKPTLLMNEEWSVDSHGNVLLVKLEPVSEELTKAVHSGQNGNEILSKQSSCCTIL